MIHSLTVSVIWLVNHLVFIHLQSKNPKSKFCYSGMKIITDYQRLKHRSNYTHEELNKKNVMTR